MRPFFALTLCIVLLGAGCGQETPSTTNTASSDANTAATNTGERATDNTTADRDANSNANTEDVTNVAVDAEADTGDTSVTPGAYVDYDADAVSEAASNGNAVLFFHASWCPTCKTLNDALSASDIPDGLTIFKTDYDTYTDLKQQYGVTYQHTLVQVDADGNLIMKWSGGSDIDSITSQLQ